MKKIHYHLPGLYEFYDFYKVFLPIYKNHPEFFYEWCDIASIYGCFEDCLWAGGRISNSSVSTKEVIELLKEYDISPRLTFSNSLLKEEHLNDAECNKTCEEFENSGLNTGIIVHSDILLNYLRNKYKSFYYVSSTTKVLIQFSELLKELNVEEFTYVVPDFRLNKQFDLFSTLDASLKKKVEFLCNECCDFYCTQRKRCYEAVSEIVLGIDNNYKCTSSNAQDGYRFSKAMKNKGFIGIDDIREKYIPLGFENFKIEGRGLGSALILEFLLYYVVKPEYQINVRELVYLDNFVDLF